MRRWPRPPLCAVPRPPPPLCAGVFGLLGAAAVGTLLIPSLVQLTLIGGGLWLGATVAQRLFAGGAGADGGSGIDPDGTIDVEATTIDRDWRDEVFKCASFAQPSLLTGCGGLLALGALSRSTRGHAGGSAAPGRLGLTSAFPLPSPLCLQGEEGAGAGAARL